MDYIDTFNPAYQNDYETNSTGKNIIDDAKKMDVGYNKLWRMIPRSDGSLKRSKIEVYTSSGIGANIRNAASGQYYSHKVGSSDEDLFFTVIMATGECRSKNGSSTLFYDSPQQYMSHMNSVVSPSLIERWTEKRNDRLRESTKEDILKRKQASIVVN